MRRTFFAVVFTAMLALTPCALAIGEIKGFVFETDQKEVTPQPGVTSIPFSFGFTNVSDQEVTITVVRASCGCTTLNLPPLPWKIAPGQSGTIESTMDVRGKYGTLMKSLSVESSAGTKHFIMKVNLPGQDPIMAQMNERLRNQQLSTVDRQIVFRGDCARCHAEPAKGRSGQELFAAVCAVCHETPHRASMVPDLANLNKPTDAHYWRTWIMFGREGSLMPAFLKERGGPLTAEQIESLVQFLATRPRSTPPVAAPAVPVAPSVAVPPAPAPVTVGR
jgi:mono/diheme cytochrome c family protein